jgi:hypothetical protein
MVQGAGTATGSGLSGPARHSHTQEQGAAAATGSSSVAGAVSRATWSGATRWATGVTFGQRRHAPARKAARIELLLNGPKVML